MTRVIPGCILRFVKAKSSKARARGASAGRYTVEGHIWVEGPEGTFLGMGRVLLLERIGEFGSITRAAASLEMSYRKAWELVESMNRQAGRPLVVATTGGKGGGGAGLTEAGSEAIALFRRMDGEFGEFREKMTRSMKG